MISEGYKNYIKSQIGEYIVKNKKVPSKTDIKHISTEPLISEYGSWKNVLIDFGFIKGETLDDIFEELLLLQRKTNKPLTIKLVNNEGINVRRLIRKYGSWTNLKQEIMRQLPKEEYISEKTLEKVKEEEDKLIQLMKKLNKIPTANEARNNGINVNRLLKKYRTWNVVKKELEILKG